MKLPIFGLGKNYKNDWTCVIMQNDYQKAMSFRAKRRRVVERSEKSRVHKVGVTEILRYALDDKMIGNFYYDTSSGRFMAFHCSESNQWQLQASRSN